MERKSNGFLKVTGILMIISGTISTIFSVLAVLGVGVLAAALGSEANMILLMVAAILALVSSVVSIVAGILGIMNAARPNKAMVCIVFGIMTAALSILGNVLTVAGGGSFSIPNLLLGLVLPALYLIGAFQNKKRT